MSSSLVVAGPCGFCCTGADVQKDSASEQLVGEATCLVDRQVHRDPEGRGMAPSCLHGLYGPACACGRGCDGGPFPGLGRGGCCCFVKLVIGLCQHVVGGGACIVANEHLAPLQL